MSDDEVPSTTEELYKYMQENTKGGHYGFVEQHSTAYYAAGWLHAFGGYILNEMVNPASMMRTPSRRWNTTRNSWSLCPPRVSILP